MRRVTKAEFHPIKKQQELHKNVNAVSIHKNEEAADKNIHEKKDDDAKKAEKEKSGAARPGRKGYRMVVGHPPSHSWLGQYGESTRSKLYSEKQYGKSSGA